MPFTDYSTSAAANTTIGGINIAEGCPPSVINDAIRQLMADARAFVDSALLIGEIRDYAGAAAPSKWLLCYGQAISQTTYAGLYAVLGTAFNTGGEAAGTFRVPDLRGRSTFGKDNMGGSTASRITAGNSGITGTTLGAAGGDERMHGHNHTATADTQGAHTHNVQGFDGTTGGGANWPYVISASGSSRTSTAAATSSGAHSHNITVAGNGSGTSQNMPPALIINKIIYAGV